MTAFAGKRPQRAALAVAVLAIGAAACSSGSSGSGKGPTKDEVALLGKANAATGTEVKLGFITDGKTGGFDASGEVPAAQAAVKYLNDYLGGVAGHKIALDICDTGGEPQQAKVCANRMLADKVPAVLLNLSGQQKTITQVLAPANVPLIASVAADDATRSDKTAFVLQNIVATSAKPAALLAASGGTRGAEILPGGVPAAEDQAKQLFPLLYKNAGAKLKVDLVFIPPHSADPTPQIQAELANKPDQVSLAGDVTFCVKAVRALNRAQYKGSIVMVSQCLSDTFAKDVQGPVAGINVTAAVSYDVADPDVKLYKAVLAKYAPKELPFDHLAPGAYVAVSGFARAMSAMKSGELTSTTIASTIRTAPAQPLPLGHGVTFQCNGKALELFPPFCSKDALITKLDAQGKTTTYQQFDTSALVHL